MFEAISASYEIGNKHLPLFYEGDELLVPYDAPLYRLLQAAGYIIKVEERKLTSAVKTTVSPHALQGNNTGLFNKILQLTTSS
jgi:urease accessory protein